MGWRLQLRTTSLWIEALSSQLSHRQTLSARDLLRRWSPSASTLFSRHPLSSCSSADSSPASPQPRALAGLACCARAVAPRAPPPPAPPPDR
eukprot:3021594-Rhodomonas_salina.1